MKLTVDSVAATRKLARKFKDLLKPQDVVCLYGDLGAGKTVFAKSLIQAFNPTLTDVPSPTFTLVQIYDTPNQTDGIWHFDFYRIKDQNEVFETGLDEALSSAISIIEWPEKIASFLPSDSLKIYIRTDKDNPNQREIEIQEEGKWQNLNKILNL